MIKEDIADYYIDLCNSFNKHLTRSQYRELDPKYSSNLIEKLWGSWTTFTQEMHLSNKYERQEIVKEFNENTDKIVISYVINGTAINNEFFETLKYYCKTNKAELGILWGRNAYKNDNFTEETYQALFPYLATKFEFKKDKTCLAQDFIIPYTQKNPLMNLDKLTTDINTIIVGSAKQYLRVLPYKQYNNERIACSTGTISILDHKLTVNGFIDGKYHTFGAILLEYNKEKGSYTVRNLVYKDNCLYDLNKKYTNNTVTTITVPGMVLGDLHLPDEDEDAIKKTKSLIKLLKPKDVMLHDVASWNSISHHELTKYYTRYKNKTEETLDLETELNEVVKRLTNLTKTFKDTTFNIVNSNHDNFIEKWLDTGEFIKDPVNARIGAKLFIDYLDNKSILEDYLPTNCRILPKNTSFSICGFELSEHGDAGICGAKGSINSFNKGFEKIIYGHTHSSELYEKAVVVGTLSKLIVRYNQGGLTKWTHTNAVIHENGTAQLVFI